MLFSPLKKSVSTEKSSRSEKCDRFILKKKTAVELMMGILI